MKVYFGIWNPKIQKLMTSMQTMQLRKKKCENLTKELDDAVNKCSQVESDLTTEKLALEKLLSGAQDALERSQGVGMALEKAHSVSQQEAERRMKPVQSENERLNDALENLPTSTKKCKLHTGTCRTKYINKNREQKPRQKPQPSRATTKEKRTTKTNTIRNLKQITD
eukprot:TRINITY_DN3168_c0_g1_i1.p1 TRINITY_DN3168_c0_g1~~TRINITY_DN3168_c0_g1_i1.p1  ORF type:complete len:168 (+),score=23.95 TRINITY_DN3168_c0_g1_i1:364-867(+)